MLVSDPPASTQYSAPPEFGVPQGELRVIQELIELTPGAGFRGGAVSNTRGQARRHGRGYGPAEPIQKCFQRRVGARFSVRAPGKYQRAGVSAGQLAGAVELRPDGFFIRRRQPTRRGGLSSTLGFRWSGDFGMVRNFHNERARGYKRCDFSVAECTEQAEQISIDGLAPEVFTGLKITGDRNRADARVQCRGIKREQPPLPVPEQADRKLVGNQCVDCGEDLLDFVSDDVTAQFVRRTVDELPVRLVGHTDIRMARVVAPTIHEERNKDTASVFGQAPGNLGGCRYAGLQSGNLLRREIAVWKGDDVGNRRPVGLQQEALTVDTLERGPDDFEDPVALTRGHFGRTVHR